MEGSAPGILGRLGEKVLGWIALALIVLGGVAIWQMGPDGRAAVWSGIWRTVVWLAVAAALPWSTRLFISRLLELSTNWAGAGLIAGMTVLDALAGLALMTVWPNGFWAWLAVIAALVVAGIYNYLVSEYLAEMAGP